jgi:electron transfer flavoprotein beta subunit
MDIVVCVKPVVAALEEVGFSSSGEVDDSGIAYDINDFDKYALEAAVQMKEKYGGQVTAISICPEEHEEILTTCVAKGADKSIRLYDEKFAGGDTFAKAKILANMITNMRPDLVLAGAESADETHGQLGGTLAGFLRYPFVSLVTKIDCDLEQQLATVERELVGG